MSKEKPLILITNDDGYQAKGIKALIESVKDLGDIVVVAPDGPRSGMSSAITCTQAIRFYSLSEAPNLKIYACTGTPADCVKLGISQITERKPDLLISGINHGSNASISVLYSGTMGAAIEGCLFNVPSIGFSLLDHSPHADFGTAKKYTRAISERLLQDSLPIGTCLNVNIPVGDSIKGTKVCRQTAGQWVEEFKIGKDGANHDVYWLTGRFDNHEPEDQNTDEWALTNGFVSIVPTKVDMTHHGLIDSLKNWENIL